MELLIYGMKQVQGLQCILINNKKLNIGDKIYITDTTGTKLTYTIYNKFETTPEDTSFYQRDTDGKAEVTLSTCTDDSSARLIIEARAE